MYDHTYVCIHVCMCICMYVCIMHIHMYRNLFHFTGKSYILNENFKDQDTLIEQSTLQIMKIC